MTADKIKELAEAYTQRSGEVAVGLITFGREAKITQDCIGRHNEAKQALHAAIDEMAASNKVLMDALKEVKMYLGPATPPCCEGCSYEWTKALEVVNAALEQYGERK